MLNARNRVQIMFYMLSKSNKYLRSKDMADFIGVSERTIKKEIDDLKKFAEFCGCNLISKRGCGYRLEILDEIKFEPVKEQLDIRYSYMQIAKPDYISRINEIIRHLIIENDYIKLDNIAKILNISKSAIKTELKEARLYLESFNLSVETRPGYGVKVVGDELNRRLCMVEMYEHHYHKAVSTINNSIFLDYFEADETERNDIRHNFLKTLRQSGIRCTDTLTQRICRYFLLMRNRLINGNYLKFPANEKKYLKRFREYYISLEIFKNLEVFDGFIVPEEEVFALELILLIWLDLSRSDDLEKFYPEQYSLSLSILKKIDERLLENWDIDFKSISQYREILLTALIPLCLAYRFKDLIKYKIVGNNIEENAIKSSPLSMAFAKTASEILENNWGFILNQWQLNLLSVRFFSLLGQINFDYIPPKILICSANGIEASEIIKNKLIRFFGEKTFDIIDIYTFYEVRGLNQDYYDYLILNFPSYSYRYTIPFISVSQIMDLEQINEIYDKIILNCFLLDKIFNSFEFSKNCFYKNFKYTNKEAFITNISFKWGIDYESTLMLQDTIKNHSDIYVNKGVAIIVIDRRFIKNNCFEIFKLEKIGTWDDFEIKYIVFISVKFNKDLQSARFIEYISHELSVNTQNIENLIANSNLEDISAIVRKNIK